MEKQKLIKFLTLMKSYVEKHQASQTKAYHDSVMERFNLLGKHEKEAFVALIKTWAAKNNIAKDDKPHAPNTPEDKAHDIVEEDESIKLALRQVKGKEKKKKVLIHLRSLRDIHNLRSDKNRQIGKEKKSMKKCGDMKPAKRQK
jgi:hypothetical protein